MPWLAPAASATSSDTLVARPLKHLLTDDILLGLMPGLTSSTIVALRASDVKRGGSIQSRSARQQPPPQSEYARKIAEAETAKIGNPAANDEVSTDRIEKTRKPTDSFTLSPEIARRVFETRAIEVIDPDTGDHIAFVRGLIFRDLMDKVSKVQCFLTKGHYLSADGARLAFRVGGDVYRVRDGFYVTPRGAHQGEWSYLGYIG